MIFIITALQLTCTVGPTLVESCVNIIIYWGVNYYYYFFFFFFFFFFFWGGGGGGGGGGAVNVLVVCHG